jgi:hypothetical protein
MVPSTGEQKRESDAVVGGVFSDDAEDDAGPQVGGVTAGGQNFGETQILGGGLSIATGLVDEQKRDAVGVGFSVYEDVEGLDVEGNASMAQGEATTIGGAGVQMGGGTLTGVSSRVGNERFGGVSDFAGLGAGAPPLTLFGPCAGLDNTGQWICYWNALLQCLVPLLTLWIPSDPPSDLERELQNVMAQMLTAQGTVSSLDCWKQFTKYHLPLDDRGRKPRWNQVWFRFRKQQDATEALVTLALKLPNGPVPRVWIDHVTRCAECDYSYLETDPSNFLILPLLSEAKTDVSTLLADYLKPREIRKNCFGGCAQKKGQNFVEAAATQHLEISDFSCLSLLIGRNPDGVTSLRSLADRLMAPVDFEPTLRLQSTDDEGIQSVRIASLVAVLCHHGKRTYEGHYTAFVRHSNGWHFYNDHLSRPASLEEVLDQKTTVYMLFYM